MILGIGTDLVDIRRIHRIFLKHGERFTRRILSPEEYRPELENQQASAYLARQFAAKEAVSKVLGTGMRGGITFTTICVLRNAQGAPLVHLQGAAQSRAQEMGVTSLRVSLSDEKDYAVAFAVAEGA